MVVKHYLCVAYGKYTFLTPRIVILFHFPFRSRELLKNSSTLTLRYASLHQLISPVDGLIG